MLHADGGINFDDAVLIVGSNKNRFAFNNGRLAELCVKSNQRPADFPGPLDCDHDKTLRLAVGATVICDSAPLRLRASYAGCPAAVFPGTRGVVTAINGSAPAPGHADTRTVDVHFEGQYFPVRVEFTVLPDDSSRRSFMPLSLHYAMTITKAQSMGFRRLLLLCEDYSWLANAAYTSYSRGRQQLYMLSVRFDRWIAEGKIPDGSGGFLCGGYVFGSRLVVKPAASLPLDMVRSDEFGRATLMGIIKATNPTLHESLVRARDDWMVRNNRPLEALEDRPDVYLSAAQLAEVNADRTRGYAAQVAAAMRTPAYQLRLMMNDAIARKAAEERAEAAAAEARAGLPKEAARIARDRGRRIGDGASAGAGLH